MPPEGQDQIDDAVKDGARQNFFKAKIIEKYRRSRPTYFLVETQPRIALMTVDKNLLYWN